eukprot:scaffold531125_cov94-Attheya_sp.AAC.1
MSLVIPYRSQGALWHWDTWNTPIEMTLRAILLIREYIYYYAFQPLFKHRTMLEYELFTK